MVRSLADIDAVDARGNTPLHYSAMNNTRLVATVLIHYRIPKQATQIAILDIEECFHER